MKRQCVLILILLLLLSSVGCRGGVQKSAGRSFAEKGETALPDRFTAAENDRFRLDYDADEKKILFLDKNTNLKWSYQPFETAVKQFDEFGYEVTVHPQIKSPLIIEYYNKETGDYERSAGFNECVAKDDFTVKKIKNGLRITYYFSKAKISIPMDYRLGKDHLTITVDPNLIAENDNILVNLELAPFFCSVKNQSVDSYLFVPSGGGTLVYPGKSVDNSQVYSETVYGKDLLKPDNGIALSNTETVKLPVFGAKCGDNAIFAIMEQGAECCELKVNAENSTLGYSAVYPCFNLRKGEFMVANNNKKTYKVYPDAHSIQPLSVSYYPLRGGDADYMGMARCYRRYLASDGKEKNKITQRMLNLKFLGGTPVTKSVLGVPTSVVEATCTVEQTESMIKEITESTGISPAVQLLGYGESGLEIGKIGGGFTLQKRIGTQNQMRKLAETCVKSDIPLFFDYDVLRLKKASKVASLGGDVATMVNGRKAVQYYYNTANGVRDTDSTGWNDRNSFYFIKRGLLPHVIDHAMAANEKMSVSGISLSTLTSFSYSDYNSKNYYSCSNMLSQTEKLLKDVKKGKFSVLGDNANAYAALLCDYVFDVPNHSSGYDIYDTDIPFYAIALKGFVPLASRPINQTGNDRIALLRAIEAGEGLTYTVAYDVSGVIFADDDRYYGSEYEGLKDTLFATVLQNKAFYDAIGDSSIVDHEVVTETLRKTVFSNGVTLFVNYSEKSAESPIGVIKPLSYSFVSEGTK